MTGCYKELKMALKIDKADMEALQYIHTCFKRSKLIFDTGHGPLESYPKAINKVLCLTVEDEFVLVMPDGSEKRFKEMKNEN